MTAFRQLMDSAVNGIISIDIEPVPLSRFEDAWQRGDQDGRRIVIVPPSGGDS